MKTFDAMFAEISEKAASHPENSKTVAELDSGRTLTFVIDLQGVS